MRFIDARRHVPALIIAACGALTMASTPSNAQDLLSSVPMKGMLSTLGIIAPDRDPIEYHERAPLVVPKTMQLPSPAPVQATARNQNWPVDPDVALKAKQKAADSAPVTYNQDSRNAENPTLSIGSMLGFKSKGAPIEPPGPVEPNRDNGFIPNGVLRAQGQQFASGNPTQADAIRPGYEPKRKYLTDPPTGYRMPSDKAKFKPQVAPPVVKVEERNGQEFLREQYLRQQGNYDPDKDQ